MKIIIETIQHSSQPYETVGYWRLEDNGDITILVSETANADYNFLVALHEMVEAKLCQNRGITTKQVDEFDIAFEEQRKKSITLSTAEPGDNHYAPYRREHCTACGIERILAAELDIDWSEYEQRLNSL